MHNLMWLAAIGIASLILTAAVGWRKKPGPSIFDWWDSEGIVWFFVIAIVLFLVACVFGVFGVEHP